MTIKPRLIILSALACEAKPLIDFYRLKKVSAKPFDYYQSTDDYQPPNTTRTNQSSQPFAVSLLVSGMGLLAMANAVGWLAGHIGTQSNCVWLNVGTAGHAQYPLGTPLLVNSCSDERHSKTYYPPLVCQWSGASNALLSVNAPSSHYPQHAAIDMEGFAFFYAAQRFASAELVQAIKIISDNTEHSLENLNAQTMSELIAQNCNHISEFAAHVVSLSRLVKSAKHSIALPNGVHFSVSQQHQWYALTQKLAALSLAPKLDDLKTAQSAQQALAYLSEILANTAPQLSA